MSDALPYRAEALVRQGDRLVWTPGLVIGRTYEASPRYHVITDDRQLLKDVPACDVRAAA